MKEAKLFQMTRMMKVRLNFFCILKNVWHYILNCNCAFSLLVPIVKRESSRRKAKENLSKKIHQQERLVEEDDDALPGLDLSDS